MNDINVLVLEDDLETLEYILRVIKEISFNNTEKLIGVTVIPDYEKTEIFINKNPQIKYDILLLDRDCFLGGSFHVVNLKNFDLDKVISISSLPEYNDTAVKMGVKRVVSKNYDNLEDFAERLKQEILKII